MIPNLIQRLSLTNWVMRQAEKRNWKPFWTAGQTACICVILFIAVRMYWTPRDSPFYGVLTFIAGFAAGGAMWNTLVCTLLIMIDKMHAELEVEKNRRVRYDAYVDSLEKDRSSPDDSTRSQT